MYCEFARVYDRLMDDVDYPQWARFYLDILARAGCIPRKMVECGCGTGSMTVEFARVGIDMVAGDLSGEMLMLAAEKARAQGVRARFVRQDMRELQVPGTVDAVVCCCDGVNYLTGDDDAASFFRAAAAALRQGGVLAFDLSTRQKLEEMTRDGLYGEDRDDVTYLWTNEPGEDHTVRMSLTFFLRESDGRYQRFDEEQTQRAYGQAEIEALLLQAGFEDIRVYGDKIIAPPGENESRIHFTARRKSK